MNKEMFEETWLGIKSLFKQIGEKITSDDMIHIEDSQLIYCKLESYSAYPQRHFKKYEKQQISSH